MVFSYLVSLVSLGAGVGFPLYKSLEAVEKKPSEVEYWLRYWAIFAILTVLIGTPPGMLIMWVIPFSELLKAGLCVWLWHEKFEGAKFAMDQLTPLYKKFPQIGEITTKLGAAEAAVKNICKSAGLPTED